MIKIINGKVYNTETAELLHEWSNRRSVGDFRHRRKDLYKTKNGNWFIHHVGGPMTDMAKSCGDNSWTGSEDIEPILENTVLRFLESHNGEDVILEHFPEKIEEA